MTSNILLRQVAVPQKDTTYWCKMYKMPDMKKKHHVIKVSMLVNIFMFIFRRTTFAKYRHVGSC